ALDVLLGISAKSAQHVFCLACNVQAKAYAIGFHSHEQLSVVSLATLVGPVEGEPQGRLIRGRAAKAVFADARQALAGPGECFQFPSMRLVQHRPHIALRESRRKFLQWFAQDELISITLRIHPFAVVMMLQVIPESKSI